MHTTQQLSFVGREFTILPPRPGPSIWPSANPHMDHLPNPIYVEQSLVLLAFSQILMRFARVTTFLFLGGLLTGGETEVSLTSSQISTDI